MSYLRDLTTNRNFWIGVLLLIVFLFILLLVALITRPHIVTVMTAFILRATPVPLLEYDELRSYNRCIEVGSPYCGEILQLLREQLRLTPTVTP